MNAFSRGSHQVLESPIVDCTAENGLRLFEKDGHVRPLDALEADIIRLALNHYRGRMSEVARRLGIGRSTLYRKLDDLHIARDR